MQNLQKNMVKRKPLKEHLLELQKLNTKHGHAKQKKHTKEYRTWDKIKQRCYNKKTHSYKWYGGRGITVCLKWKNNFKQFLNDMGFAPSIDYSIDRINPNGNYEPSNCRWILKKENSKLGGLRRNKVFL